MQANTKMDFRASENSVYTVLQVGLEKWLGDEEFCGCIFFFKFLFLFWSESNPKTFIRFLVWPASLQKFPNQSPTGEQKQIRFAGCDWNVLGLSQELSHSILVVHSLSLWLH